MNVTQAYEIAEDLVRLMKPWAERVEIAGSIRRQKTDVKDIELVAIPKWEEGGVIVDMFQGEREKVNMLYEYLRSQPRIQWIKPGVPEVIPWPIKPDGKYWRGLVDGKIKLDLFLTTPEQFGLIFLIRTGPADFSHRFVMKKYQGGSLPNDYRVEDGHLKKLTGEIIPTPDEETVFRLAGMKFVPPEERK